MSPLWLTLLYQLGCATTPRAVEGHDFLLPSCDPLSLELVFGLLQPECDSAPGKRGVLRFKLGEPLPEDGVATYDLGEKGTASATWCSANEQSCLPAVSGVLRINGLDHGIAVSGDYSMIFGNEESIEGVFGAEWCATSVPCDETQ